MGSLPRRSFHSGTGGGGGGDRLSPPPASARPLVFHAALLLLTSSTLVHSAAGGGGTMLCPQGKADASAAAAADAADDEDAVAPAEQPQPPDESSDAAEDSVLRPLPEIHPTMEPDSLKMAAFARTTGRASPVFTPLIPGLIAVGIGITLVPQRPWVPQVPLRKTTAGGPRFEGGEDGESNVTARAGSTAYLDCKIEMRQEEVVTWLHRKRDSIQLLTVGRQSYSVGSRFLLSHRKPDNWRLQILSVMKSDEGLYECQIATQPIKVRKVFFEVTAPELKIVDEDCNELLERRYKAGSEVKLTCLATQLEEGDGEMEEDADGGEEGGGEEGGLDEGAVSVEGRPSPFGSFQKVVGRVLWRHGGSAITQGKVAKKTLWANTSPDGKNVSVTLTFQALSSEDGGNYTCSLGVISSPTVYIQIVNGESDGEIKVRNTAAPERLVNLRLMILCCSFISLDGLLRDVMIFLTYSQIM